MPIRFIPERGLPAVVGDRRVSRARPLASGVTAAVFAAFVLGGCSTADGTSAVAGSTAAKQPAATQSAATGPTTAQSTAAETGAVPAGPGDTVVPDKAATQAVMAQAVTPRDPQRSPVAALSALLEAEKTRSHKSSFALLSTEALRKYPTLEDWSNHQIDLPQVTGFSDVTAVDGQVSALVEHMPGIDPFIGIQFAQERQTWHAQREGDGWLLDSEPLVEPIMPPADLATSAAEKWVEAVRACDQKAARESQAVANLFGISEGASKVCGSTASYSGSPPVAVTPSPETSALVAQYGAGILRYVQTVAVTGGSKSFVAYLVPIGDVWKVIGVND